MSSKLSLILGDCDRAFNAVLDSGVRMPVIKVHNKSAYANIIRERWGANTVVIMRHTDTENIISDGVSMWADPEVTAERWFSAMRPHFSAAPFAFFEVGAPGFHSDDQNMCTHYAKTIMAAMRLMALAGLHGVVLTFYEGTPRTLSDGYDGWSPYWPVVQLASQLGFLLGMQGYWVDGNMSLDDDWHCFRLLRVLRDYPGKFPPGTKFVLTEYGIDLRDGRGWREALGADHGDVYVNGLIAGDHKWRNAIFPQGIELIGTCLFILQEWGQPKQWDGFNLWEVLPQLTDYIKSQQDIIEVPPETPVEPPAPEGWRHIKVIAGVNQRSMPSITSEKLGYIAPGAWLMVEYPPINGYVEAVGQGFWIYEPNITIQE